MALCRDSKVLSFLTMEIVYYFVLSGANATDGADYYFGIFPHR